MLAYCFLFLLTFLTNLRPSIQQYMPEYAGYVCPPGIPTYLKSSTYSNNLQTLLSSLSSIDSKFFSTGFQNLTVGENPDMVYGLYLCRGDLSRQECCECVSFACNDILRQCPYVKEAWINYDKCMLGYANWNILLNLVPVMANQSDEFNKVLISLLNELVEEVVASPRKFAFKKKKYTSSQSVYALGQCTPYVTKETCSSCLQQAIKNLSYNTHIKFGERPMWPSCDLRYESYLFYNDSFAQPPLPPPKHGKGKKSVVLTIEIAMPIALSTLLFIACYCFRAKRAKKTYDTRNLRLTQDGDDIKTAGSLQFDFKVIEAATDKFSLVNKLGQGGFVVVYKGTFPNGLQVAVKRLSKKSGQGEREFKNEVIVVAKLQHKNLVRLLGFCFDREEKLLVYEFAHNKSLDYFLFESALKSRLDWTMRYKIIGGIARGILYLHQDSRLTIIHRDLKAANILLDADMNPKVADFGMARIFEFYQKEANTRRVVGTYGYMSPEYAMYGQFSMKSDVYSFGVLVLEIISSKKNSSLYTMDGSLGNLVTYTWRLWSNGSPLELVDSSFRENYERNEIIRCIHIALLCVQEDADDRPMMSVILQMLTTSSIVLAAPRPPGHLFRSRPAQAGPSTDKSALCSIDEASITTVAPR